MTTLTIIVLVATAAFFMIMAIGHCIRADKLSARCDVLNTELIDSQLEIETLKTRIDNQCELLTEDVTTGKRLRAELADAIASETAANRNADRLAQQMRQIHAASSPQPT